MDGAFIGLLEGFLSVEVGLIMWTIILAVWEMELLILMISPIFMATHAALLIKVQNNKINTCFLIIVCFLVYDKITKQLYEKH